MRRAWCLSSGFACSLAVLVTVVGGMTLWLREVSDVSRHEPFASTHTTVRPASASSSGLAGTGSRLLSDPSPLYELKSLETVARTSMILSY
jgi:hypothetical protein